VIANESFNLINQFKLYDPQITRKLKNEINNSK